MALNGNITRQTSLSGTIVRASGGGVSDYTQLQNLPSINDVTLLGNKTTSDLGLAEKLFESGTGTDSIISKCSEIANTASGESATAIGRASVASGKYSFAGGNRATGYGSSTASGDCAFAYGATAVASDTCSVALGMCSTASGSRALSAGFWVEASANQAQAFGQRTVANAPMSTAFGNYTIATGRACFVAGQYNVEDTNEIDTSHGSGARKYIFIVGNGTASNARSNALALDWDGHLVVAADPVEDMGVVTKRYVDNIAIGSRSINANILVKKDGTNYQLIPSIANLNDMWWCAYAGHCDPNDAASNMYAYIWMQIPKWAKQAGYSGKMKAILINGDDITFPPEELDESNASWVSSFTNVGDSGYILNPLSMANYNNKSRFLRWIFYIFDANSNEVLKLYTPTIEVARADDVYTVTEHFDSRQREDCIYELCYAYHRLDQPNVSFHTPSSTFDLCSGVYNVLGGKYASIPIESVPSDRKISIRALCGTSEYIYSPGIFIDTSVFGGKSYNYTDDGNGNIVIAKITEEG